MRTIWLRMAVLAIATIMVHEGWMATSGHAAAVADHATAGQYAAGSHHRHGHHGLSQGETQDGTEPTGSMPTHCEPVRVAAPTNRAESPPLDTIPVALLPNSAILMLFAATSRDIVETPPAHPPDLDRAFFQVYRI